MTVPGDRIELPPRLRTSAGQGGPAAAFVRRLPGLLADTRRAWGLTIGRPFAPGGVTAWVAPARDRHGRDVVLKLTWRHAEGADEAAGLRAWDGQGMVRLFDERPTGEDAALLLERLTPGEPLSQRRDERDQDSIIAALLRRLWIEPPAAAGFRSLGVMAEAWARAARERGVPRTRFADPDLIAWGIDRFAALAAEPVARPVLLTTDLHAGNVLNAGGSWRAIDPKPFVGDPAYDVIQHLLNCRQRLHTDPLALSATVAAQCDLDPERVRHWLLARCCLEAVDHPELEAVARVLAGVAP